MLFYDWPKIKKYSNRKVRSIRTIFESMMDFPRPEIGRVLYDRIDFTGNSFLVNPEGLLESFQTIDQVDCANYLMLASYRNYADYKLTGDLTLPLKYTKIPLTTLEKNSLLKIEGDSINFILEKQNVRNN